MTTQALPTSVNDDINVILVILGACGLLAIGFLLGIASAHGSVTSKVQHALDRGARHIRLYARSPEAAANGEFGRRALEEAVAILNWRTVGFNYLAKPDSRGRIRPDGIPRRQWLENFQIVSRVADERGKIRNEIFARVFGYDIPVNPDDTYAGKPREVAKARYRTGE